MTHDLEKDDFIALLKYYIKGKKRRVAIEV